jgi:hypothetical protein
MVMRFGDVRLAVTSNSKLANGFNQCFAAVDFFTGLLSSIEFKKTSGRAAQQIYFY